MTKVIAPGTSATVSTPATTANLGPGFDALGLALDWVDQATVSATADGLTLSLSGEGEETLPRNRRHLVVRTLELGLDSLGARADGLHFEAHNTIPLARGLGSSSAAIAAGLGLAWGLARPNEDLDRQWAFDLAVDIEGHPDNVGPAIYGGFTIGWQNQGTWKLVHSPVSQDNQITALVPPTALKTTQARSVMPSSIPLEDAIANSARTALLVHALSTDPALLLEATEDFLHQEYRRKLYPISLQLVDELRAEGLAAAISGAGPTVVVFHTRSRSALTDLVLDEVLAKNPAFMAFARHDLGVGSGLRLH